MRYRADLHIHSCLSPCASLEMAPGAIVSAARSAGLNAIALTDHNCAFNLPAFAECCAREKMDGWFGLEVTTLEEAHVLCLFDELEPAVEWGDAVYESLPEIANQPERFGDQPIVDADENILGFAEKLLISASAFDVSSLTSEVRARGGLVVPAHIDRAMFGIVAQLGFLPDEPFDAVELTAGGAAELARGFPIVRSSDAHDLEAIGRAWTEWSLEAFTTANARRAWAR